MSRLGLSLKTLIKQPGTLTLEDFCMDIPNAFDFLDSLGEKEILGPATLLKILGAQLSEACQDCPSKVTNLPLYLHILP